MFVTHATPLKNNLIMKSTLLIFTFLLASISLNAQTQKGNWTFGGSAGFNFNSTNSKFKTDNFESDPDTNTQLSFLPSAGYFVIDNLAVGLQVQIANFKSESTFDAGGGDTFESEFTTKSTSINPFVRYYFGSNSIRPYVQGQLGFGGSTLKSETSGSNDDESKNSLFLYGGFGGVAFFINEHVSIDVGINYTSTRLKDKDDPRDDVRTVSNTFGFGAGFNIFL